MSNVLFPQVGELLHGGDYNIEQWLDRPDILKQDIEWMKNAKINTVTLGVFSWSVYEQQEGEYNFEWLINAINSLYAAGIYTVLATPSGARPAWLDAKYPSAMRVGANNQRNHHGVRHNHCMSSLEYREKVKQIDTRLANAVKNNPAVILWHISNEFGGECYCPLCAKRFQKWLENKYKTIENLNEQWWTTFWSHRYNSFEQIEPPFSNGENSIHGLNLDWKRFTTSNTADFMQFEQDILREITPNVPHTTNFMRLYNGLDYEELSKSLDIISWDSYPFWGTTEQPPEKVGLDVAFEHSIMRNFKSKKPFMLMESTPSIVNWHQYNKLKRPLVHLQSSLQAIACGSDTVQYFQWRKGRGSFEQYHGAVIDHLGSCDTRVYRETVQVGNALEKLKSVQGSFVDAQAALVFDWSNRWAIQDMAGLSKNKGYEDFCKEQFNVFMQNDVELDVVTPSADFSCYKLLILPMLYMVSEQLAEKIKAYIAKGGTVVATYLTAYVNENTLCYMGGTPAGGLKDVFGMYVEEIDTLYPSEKNNMILQNEAFEIKDFCEIIRLNGATTLGVYGEDFYANTPVLTKSKYENGNAYYVGARLCEQGMEAVYKSVWQCCDISFNPLPQGVEHHVRTNETERFDFYFNYNNCSCNIEICKQGIELLTNLPATKTITLSQNGVAVIKSDI